MQEPPAAEGKTNPPSSTDAAKQGGVDRSALLKLLAEKRDARGTNAIIKKQEGGMAAVAKAVVEAINNSSDAGVRSSGIAALAGLAAAGPELLQKLLAEGKAVKEPKQQPMAVLDKLGALGHAKVPEGAPPLIAEGGGLGLLAFALLNSMASEQSPVRKLACKATMALTYLGPDTSKLLQQLGLTQTVVTLPPHKALAQLADASDAGAKIKTIEEGGGAKFVNLAVRTYFSSAIDKRREAGVAAFAALAKGGSSALLDLIAAVNCDPNNVHNVIEHAGGIAAVTTAVLAAIDGSDEALRGSGAAALAALAGAGTDMLEQLINEGTAAKDPKLKPIEVLEKLEALPVEAAKEGAPPLVAEGGGLGLVAFALLDSMASEHASLRMLASKATIALSYVGPDMCKSLHLLGLTQTLVTLPLNKALVQLAEVPEADMETAPEIVQKAGGARLVNLAVRSQLNSGIPEERLDAVRAFATLSKGNDSVKEQLGMIKLHKPIVLSPHQALQRLAAVPDEDMLTRHLILYNTKGGDGAAGFEAVTPSIFHALRGSDHAARLLACRALHTLAKEGEELVKELMEAGLAARLATSSPEEVIEQLAGREAGGQELETWVEHVMNGAGGFGVIALRLAQRLASKDVELKNQACDAIATLSLAGSEMRELMLNVGFVVKPAPLEPAQAVTVLASDPPISHMSVLYTMHKAGGFKAVVLAIVDGLSGPTERQSEAGRALSILMEGKMGEELKQLSRRLPPPSRIPVLSSKQALGQLAAVDPADVEAVHEVLNKAGGVRRTLSAVLKGLQVSKQKTRDAACKAFAVLASAALEMQKIVRDLEKQSSAAAIAPAACVPLLAAVKVADPLSAQHIMEMAGGFALVSVALIDSLSSPVLNIKLQGCTAFAMLANRCAAMPDDADEQKEKSAAPSGAPPPARSHLFAKRILEMAGCLELVAAVILTGCEASLQHLRLTACKAFAALVQADSEFRELIKAVGAKVCTSSISTDKAMRMLASFTDADYVYAKYVLELAGGFGLVAVCIIDTLEAGSDDPKARLTACKATLTLARSSVFLQQQLYSIGVSTELSKLFPTPAKASPAAGAAAQGAAKGSVASSAGGGDAPAATGEQVAAQSSAKGASAAAGGTATASAAVGQSSSTWALAASAPELCAAALEAAAALCNDDALNRAAMVKAGVVQAVLFSLGAKAAAGVQGEEADAGGKAEQAAAVAEAKPADAGGEAEQAAADGKARKAEDLVQCALALTMVLWQDLTVIQTMQARGVVAQLVALLPGLTTRRSALQLLQLALPVMTPTLLCKQLDAAGAAQHLLAIIQESDCKAKDPELRRQLVERNKAAAKQEELLIAVDLLVCLHDEKKPAWEQEPGVAMFVKMLDLSMDKSISQVTLHASLKALSQICQDDATAAAVAKDLDLFNPLMDMLGEPEVMDNLVYREFIASALRSISKHNCKEVISNLTNLIRHSQHSTARMRSFMNALYLVVFEDQKNCSMVNKCGMIPFLVLMLVNKSVALNNYALGVLLEMAQRLENDPKIDVREAMYKSKIVPRLSSLLKNPMDSIFRNSRQLLSLILQKYND